jgi:hypothetical protein
LRSLTVAFGSKAEVRNRRQPDIAYLFNKSSRSLSMSPAQAHPLAILVGHHLMLNPPAGGSCYVPS